MEKRRQPSFWRFRRSSHRAISATLTHKDYNCLVLLYDNESCANTDIQLSSQTPYGAVRCVG